MSHDSESVCGLYFVQGTAAEVSLHLHLLANGLVWVAPEAARPGMRKSLMAGLSNLPETYLPGSTAERPVSF